jgi:Spy/CpxP family protein refolding chaperone
MMDHTERLALVHRAKKELELTEGAYDRLRQAMVDKLFSTPIEAQALRERIYVAVQSMDTVREMLRQATFDEAAVNHETLLAEHGFQR